MARAHYVQKARKDNPVAKKGESYYWWKFRFGGKLYSKTRPKRSQLTQSAHLGQIYDIEDSIADFEPETLEDIQSQIEDWASELENLAYEAEESRSNMPEHLQDGPTGEMLQERADATREMAENLQVICLERNEGSYPTEAEQVSEVMEDLREICYEGE